MKKLFFALVIPVFLSSCNVPRIELSDREKELEHRLKVAYKCDLELRHDYDAVSENKSNGQFWVSINNSTPDICKLDSTSIKDLAVALTDSILPVLTHRENYELINFHFSTNIAIDERMDKQVCNKGILVYLNPGKTTKFEFYYENF
ncbi:hypothetical protein [Pontibacter fetidus]|uniref:Type IV secretion system putative lipoprotein virB7 n=1 Tax=Pontibacter fetidus TaxID=2700082 RepID=A0A6B2H4G9_9BACT|nr:hypothetical protein [Pontibacter fetidus]NDK57351.1 hypothetical protein [Pontibacter fetidus]